MRPRDAAWLGTADLQERCGLNRHYTSRSFIWLDDTVPRRRVMRGCRANYCFCSKYKAITHIWVPPVSQRGGGVSKATTSKLLCLAAEATDLFQLLVCWDGNFSTSSCGLVTDFSCDVYNPLRRKSEAFESSDLWSNCWHSSSWRGTTKTESFDPNISLCGVRLFPAQCFML